MVQFTIFLPGLVATVARVTRAGRIAAGPSERGMQLNARATVPSEPGSSSLARCAPRFVRGGQFIPESSLLRHS